MSDRRGRSLQAQLVATWRQSVFVSDFLPDDEDEESEESAVDFEDSFFSDDDELSDPELSEDESLLLEAELALLVPPSSHGRACFVP